MQRMITAVPQDQVLEFAENLPEFHEVMELIASHVSDDQFSQYSGYESTIMSSERSSASSSMSWLEGLTDVSSENSNSSEWSFLVA